MLASFRGEAPGGVEAALARGWMRDDGRGFAPDRPVTRQEAAVVLMRALALPDEGAGKGNLPVDGAAVAPWARAAVRTFVARVPALVDAAGASIRMFPSMPPGWRPFGRRSPVRKATIVRIADSNIATYKGLGGIRWNGRKLRTSSRRLGRPATASGR
ncbi:S-layer homology domain-containing protein [Hydrogenibacillus schlegelii]|uniref:S-layer homology domain-containing protein n=1 Tax=Hydrogenibacillus schlegelii TaxID=1484 RepID=UPI003C6D73D5